MATRNRSLGISHVTVVPTNAAEVATDEADQDSDAESPADAEE